MQLPHKQTYTDFMSQAVQGAIYVAMLMLIQPMPLFIVRDFVKSGRTLSGGKSSRVLETWRPKTSYTHWHLSCQRLTMKKSAPRCEGYGRTDATIQKSFFFSSSRMQPNTDLRFNESTVGKVLLQSRGFYTEEYWYWICVFAVLGFSVLFNVLFVAALTFLNRKPQSISFYFSQFVLKINIYALWSTSSFGWFKHFTIGWWW